MEKDAKSKLAKKKKTRKVGGLWVDLKQYPLLEQLETKEQTSCENKAEDGGDNGKGKTKKVKKKAASD